MREEDREKEIRDRAYDEVVNLIIRESSKVTEFSDRVCLEILRLKERK